MNEKTSRPKIGHQGPAGRIHIGVIDRQIGLAPGLQLGGQLPVPGFKKWSVQKALVGHQLPPNNGFSLATKAR